MNCIVFGGSKGIGRSIANLLLQNKCRVAVASRSLVNVEEYMSGGKTDNGLPLVTVFIAHAVGHSVLGKAGHGKQYLQQILSFSCDVSDDVSVSETMQQINNKFGSIDVVVNAAGINRDGLLVKANHKDIQDQINTNLIGTINTCKAALRPMLQKRRGCIINIGSVVGQVGNAGQTIYSATKAGLTGFTKSLAREVGSKGIRVNLVAPGFIETEMTEKLTMDRFKQTIPLARFGRPEEVAQTCYFIMTNQYVTGQVFYVDGGLHIST